MKRILLPLFVALCIASTAQAQPAGGVPSANPGAAADTTKQTGVTGAEGSATPGAAPTAASSGAWYDQLAAKPKDTSTNFWLPKAVNAEANNADMMFYAVLGLSIFFFVAIAIAVVYFTWKYRGRPGHKAQPSPAHNDVLEITWTVIPTIICVFLFYFGWRAYIKVVTPPQKAVEINVLAWRWAWEFKHANGVTDNNLHVPVNTPVRLVMTSKDVLHSFYIPVMRVKQDLVPRRYTYAWFEATKPGTYQMYCAEYCGTNHSQMKPAVVVHEPGGYERYLNDKAAESTNMPPVELGKMLYEKKGCNACHTVDGTPRVGPTWASKDWGKPITMSDGKTVTMDENYVRESILSPLAKARPGYPPSMPSFEGQLKEKEIAGLIAYIKSLKQ
jgi:cytochrome c oxidase subunit 2